MKNKIMNNHKTKLEAQSPAFLVGDVSGSFIGKECFWVDKVTHSKRYNNRPLGKAISEQLHSLHQLPIVWFSNPFLGFSWQYKSDVRL
jgi:hypothetical protein